MLPLGGKVLFYGLTCWKSAPKSGSIPASPARLVSLSAGGNSSEGGATKDQRGSLGEENLLWGAIVQISSSLSLSVALPAEASPTSWKSLGHFSSSLGLYRLVWLPEGGKQATACPKKRLVFNASFAPMPCCTMSMQKKKIKRLVGNLRSIFSLSGSQA